MKLATTGVLAAAMALGLAAAAEAQDVIRLKSGTEIKAKVTAMTSQSVTYSETGGKVTTAKREDITSVDLAKAKGGDAYENILKEMKSEPEPVGSQAELELAKIKFTAGDFESARPMFEKVSNNPASMFAGDAKLWSLRCIRGMKKLDELESACSRILGDKASSTPGLLQAAAPSLPEIQLSKNEKDKTTGRDIPMICLNR